MYYALWSKGVKLARRNIRLSQQMCEQGAEPGYERRRSLGVGDLIALYAAGFWSESYSAQCPPTGALGPVFTEVTCHFPERMGRQGGRTSYCPGYGAARVMWP
jgi:hypothetical protein